MSDYPLESFIFYRSFRDAINEMDDADKLATLLAITDYALYGVEPKLKGVMPRAVFTVVRPSIDTNRAKRKAGKRGGRPPKEPLVNNLENHRFSKSENTDTGTVADTDTGTGADTSIGADKPPKRPRFVPPTLDEVTAYVKERGSAVDPQGFIDFYSSKGWMVGKSLMRDWKAACRNAEKWERWDKRPATGDRDRIKTDADYGEELFFTK